MRTRTITGAERVRHRRAIGGRRHPGHGRGSASRGAVAPQLEQMLRRAAATGRVVDVGVAGMDEERAVAAIVAIVREVFG